MKPGQSQVGWINVVETYATRLYIRGMKPWKRFAFVFVAYSLALLHTAVPHQHQAFADGTMTLSAAGCVSGQSMGGFLKMVFSTDLGHGHLETFQKSAEAQIDFSLALVSILLVFTPLVSLQSGRCESVTSFGTHIEKLHKRLLLFSSAHFRAPPFLI